MENFPLEDGCLNKDGQSRTFQGKKKELHKFTWQTIYMTNCNYVNVCHVPFFFFFWILIILAGHMIMHVSMNLLEL